jgi:hypothetical protein
VSVYVCVYVCECVCVCACVLRKCVFVCIAVCIKRLRLEFAGRYTEPIRTLLNQLAVKFLLQSTPHQNACPVSSDPRPC